MKKRISVMLAVSLVTAALLAGSWLMPGCEEGWPTASEGNICYQFAQIMCRWITTCCEFDEVAALMGYDPKNPETWELVETVRKDVRGCEDVWHANCENTFPLFLLGLQAGRLSIDDAKWTTCRKAFETGADKCESLTTAFSYVKDCQLNKILTGKQDEQGLCYMDEECKTGLWCLRNTMPSIMPDGGLHANAGYCVPRIGNSTDVCWSKAKCDENQYCFPSTPSQKVCVVIPYQDTDKFCSTDADCKNDLFCDTSKSKCASKADVGGKCTRDEHCKSFRCNIGKRNCIASADKGQGCNYSEQCKGGLWCLPQPAVGECRAPDIQVGAGEKCDNKNIFCQQGLRCFAGFCSAPIPDGQTCAADADCLDASFCNALLKCEARKGAGAECTKSSMCTADLYCFTGASPAVCTIRKNEGEACTAGSCAQGFFCSGDLGICVAQFGDGSKCMSGDQCVKGLMCKQYEGICTDRVNNDAYCDVSNECKEDLFCSPATLDKACWQKRNAQLNEPCLGSNVYCATGLYCSFDTGTCVNRKDDGQACTSSGQCKDTLYCNIITTEKKCRPRGALDADCGGTGMAPCGKDFYCDGTKCKNRLDATQPCSSSSMCKADLYCDLGGTNQCTQRKDAGADCTATSQCKENMKCDTSVTPNKCAALGGQGVKCTANADCQENYYCRQATGKCASRLGTGVECPVLDACVKADACNTKATCKDLLGEGEKCSYDTDCKKELVCDREWLECSKKPEGAKTGDHCRANYECQSGFCSQEICAAACMGHYKQ